MKNKLIITVFFIAIIFSAIPINSNASSNNLYLNNLDFNAKVNSDGSMYVTEIWDIDIRDTNTLFKTFKTDNTKYSSITDVKVTDITNEKNNIFNPINTYMYHVTENCYYGLKNSDGNFEIAWGVGLDSDSEVRKYKIEYRIKDAIAKYNDYSELYWQFVGNDFEISAKNITGTITLPKKVDNKDEIKVWGHIKKLNGTIYTTDLNKIEFQVDNYEGNQYVEIRTLFPTNLISTSERNYNSNILENVLAEETRWAEEANKQRKMKEMFSKLALIGYIIICIIIFILLFKKIAKYRNIFKGLNKYKPTNKLEYYRELPDEKSTPGEALLLQKNLYNDFNSDFGKVFAATLLNLTLKKYIELRVDETEKGKKAIKIIRLNKEKSQLKRDEEDILEFLEDAISSEEEINMVDLEKYIKNHPTKIELLIGSTHSNVKNSVIENKYFDEEEYLKYNKYTGKLILYIVLAVITAIPFFPIAIIAIVDAIYCNKIKNEINVLTQTGTDQKEMWTGLKKYMEEFSLLKERKIPELVIWEKYLVYATVFGISKKVLKQLKIVYPNIDEMENINTSSYLYFMYHSDFNTNFSDIIDSSVASAVYSSGTGRWRRIFRWRRWPEAAGGGGGGR